MTRPPLRIASFLLLAIAAIPAWGIGSKPVKLALKRPDAAEAVRPSLPAWLTERPIGLEFHDARGADDPSVIGVYREKRADVYLWKSTEPVEASVRGMVEAILAAWSAPITEGAEASMRLDLARFEIAERSETFGSSYEAHVRLVGSLRSQGTVAKTWDVTGTAKRSGADGKGAICNEVLSLALQNALMEIVGAADPASVAATPPAAPQGAVEPEAIYRELLRLKEGGVSSDVMVSYVAERTLSRPLTVDEILQWKNAGIPDDAIKAATARERTGR